MKTPVRREVLVHLDQLNDQLRFFTFAEYELLDRLQDFSTAVRDHFTSDTFARNPQAKRIHVRLKDLPSFQQANRSFTFGAYVSTSYEVMSTFFGRALDLAASCGVLIATIGEKEPERKYAQAVAAIGWVPPPAHVTDLLTFIRLRRNGFIHLHATPAARFVTFCARSGPQLNVQWEAARDTVNFTLPSVGGFSESDAVAYLKLLRIALAALDEHLAASLGEAAIVNYLTRQKFGADAVRMSNEIARRRARKITSLARHAFGIVATPSIVDTAVRSTGVR